MLLTGQDFQHLPKDPFGQSLDGVGAGAVGGIPGTQRHKVGEAVGQLALD